MDLNSIKKLMKKRDLFCGHYNPQERENNLLALADEVPGLIEEIERLEKEIEKLNNLYIISYARVL